LLFIEDGTTLESDKEFTKNNIEYKINSVPQTKEDIETDIPTILQGNDDGPLVPENWREIADLRLKMLDDEYCKFNTKSFLILIIRRN